MQVSILEYGAVGDGVTMNTQSIQTAIDACAQSGGGQVVIPAGVFLSGTIWLKSHVELHLAHGAVLKASEDYRDYNDPEAFPQNSYSPHTAEVEGWVGRHLLIALEQADVAVTGSGVIDGSGDAYFEPWQKNPHKWDYCWAYGFSREKDKVNRRPGQVLCFVECEQVRVLDITFRNTTCWCCLLHGCDYVTVRGLHVFNEKHYANTDGLDIDTCRFVTVSDCIIDTGDDAIAIRCNAKKLKKDNNCCEYITISNCVLASSSSVFRLGVGIGEIRNISISNIVMHRGAVGFNFMTAYLGRGNALIDHIHISNIIAEHVSQPFVFHEENNCRIQNITFDHYHIKAMCSSWIHARTPGAVANLAFRNMEITMEQPPYELPHGPNAIDAAKRSGYLLDFDLADNVTLENVRITIPAELAGQWQGKARFVNCSGVEKRNCNF